MYNSGFHILLFTEGSGYRHTKPITKLHTGSYTGWKGGYWRVLRTSSGNGSAAIPMGGRKRSGILYFFKKYWMLNLILLPGLIYFVIFKYIPMYGIVIAFKDYQGGSGGFLGMMTADWRGFQYFKMFFGSVYFGRLLRNSLLISVYRLAFSFPAPIILALLLNELRNLRFKRVMQTITYMPHFLSWVVVSSFMIILLSPSSGPINGLLNRMGINSIFFLNDTRYFRSVLVISEIWKSVGWGTIIYLAAITGVDQELYEAARIDGANRWQQTLRITLPGIKETIAILLILAVGRILDENFEQIFNLYSPPVYEVADVFETYVYRQGVLQAQFSYTTAVGLFKSVSSLVLVMTSNFIAKRLGSEGIW